jgi:hypothetical protein
MTFTNRADRKTQDLLDDSSGISSSEGGGLGFPAPFRHELNSLFVMQNQRVEEGLAFLARCICATSV